MKHSVNRILTTHVGSLSRLTDLIQMDHIGPIRYTGHALWYYYLESKISFPFQARCIAAKPVSPLRKGETVEVAQIRRQGRTIPVPLSQLATIDVHELAERAIGDWHFWSRRAAFSAPVSQTDGLAASE